MHLLQFLSCSFSFYFIFFFTFDQFSIKYYTAEYLPCILKLILGLELVPILKANIFVLNCLWYTRLGKFDKLF